MTWWPCGLLLRPSYRVCYFCLMLACQYSAVVSSDSSALCSSSSPGYLWDLFPPDSHRICFENLTSLFGYFHTVYMDLQTDSELFHFWKDLIFRNHLIGRKTVGYSLLHLPAVRFILGSSHWISLDHTHDCPHIMSLGNWLDSAQSTRTLTMSCM